MTTEYDSALALAARLIIKKGRNVKYQSLTADPSMPDPDRPWDKNPALPSTPKTIKACIFGFTVNQILPNYSSKMINGTTILQNDKQALLYAKDLGFEPKTGDKIWDSGNWWRVIAVDDLTPGDVTVMYTLLLRK